MPNYSSNTSDLVNIFVSTMADINIAYKDRRSGNAIATMAPMATRD